MLNEDKVLAELAALKTICLALIASHPDQRKLHNVLSQMKEQAVANSLARPVPNAAWQEAERILTDTLSRLEKDLGAQG